MREGEQLRPVKATWLNWKENHAIRRYLVAEYWGHIFAGSEEQMVRFVFDREAQDLAYMEFSDGTVATRAEMDDVKDSLLNANREALEDPAGWGFDEEADIPDWAKPAA